MGLEGGPPPSAGRSSRFTGRSRCLKSHQQHPDRPHPGPALGPRAPGTPCPPPGRLPPPSSGDVQPTGPARKQRQMDGQCAGWAQSQEPEQGEEVPGSRESHSRKATLPDQGQDGEYRRCLGHGSQAVALLVGQCRELGAPGSSMTSPQASVSSSVKWHQAQPQAQGCSNPQPWELGAGPGRQALSLQLCSLLPVLPHLRPPLAFGGLTQPEMGRALANV